LGRDLVLCVDDEAMVRLTCNFVLSGAGFRVAVAENGAAGLRVFKERRDEICVVLTDVVMPKLNGLEMAKNIREIDPQAKILVMSGYSDRVLEAEGRKRFPFIRKPFINAVLIDKIRSLIENADAKSSGSE
jgi:two-component system cell cycle sensor histidine kinase/response regulator CckA